MTLAKPCSCLAFILLTPPCAWLGVSPYRDWFYYKVNESRETGVRRWESCRQDRWLKVPFLLLSFVLWKHTLVTGWALRQHNVLTFNVTSSIKNWTDENPAGRQKLRVLFWMKIRVWKPERYQLNYEQPQGQGCDGWLWVPSWAQGAAESWSPASLLFCKGQEFTARLPEGAGKAATFERPGCVLGSRSFSEITSVIWTIKHTGWILSDISYKLFLFSCLIIFMNQLEQKKITWCKQNPEKTN